MGSVVYQCVSVYQCVVHVCQCGEYLCISVCEWGVFVYSVMASVQVTVCVYIIVYMLLYTGYSEQYTICSRYSNSTLITR